LSLKNKRILITAGPTWLAIDRVRVISNTATGETGILLAERLQGIGAKVTLLLGAAEHQCLNKKIELIRFKFFGELRHLIKKELTSKKYDIAIHTAAVADYRPKNIFRKKIKSDIKEWKLTLVPTAKIIDLIRTLNSSLFIVGFKFETTQAKRILIRKAEELIQRANLDLAVANTVAKNKYLAYIVDNYNQTCGPIHNKKDTAGKLINLIRRKYGKAKNHRQD